VVKSPAIDTSPLIFLSKASLIDLLQAFSPEIVVPQAVVAEVTAYGEEDVTVKTLNETDWLMAKNIGLIPEVIQKSDLGLGESEVLTWGYNNPGTEVILDDLAARRCADTLGIPTRGTLGLVLTAKQRGHIPRARPILEQLRQSGMYLSDRILEQALSRVGE